MSLLEHHVATTGCVLRTGSGPATDLHIILLVEGIMPSSNRYAFHQPSLSYPLVNIHNGMVCISPPIVRVQQLLNEMVNSHMQFML